MTFTESPLNISFFKHNNVYSYNQSIQIVHKNEFYIQFFLNGTCDWGIQSHDYCQDASFFTFDVKINSIIADSVDLTFNDILKEHIIDIINQHILISDDSKTSETSDEFTGLIKINYDFNDAFNSKILKILKK